MSTSNQQRQVKCPYCGGKALFSPENAFRPFCSERCRLLDLGMWASEEFRIPTADQASVQDPLPGHEEHEED